MKNNPNYNVVSAENDQKESNKDSFVKFLLIIATIVSVFAITGFIISISGS